MEKQNIRIKLRAYDNKILEKHGVKVLGTSVESINKAEDRLLFRNLMNELGEPVPPSFSCNTIEEAVEAANKISYPVIVRPAFTLGGLGGGIAKTKKEYVKIVKEGLILIFLNLQSKSKGMLANITLTKAKVMGSKEYVAIFILKKEEPQIIANKINKDKSIVLASLIPV